MTDASIVARQFVKGFSLDVCSEKERVRLYGQGSDRKIGCSLAGATSRRHVVSALL